MSSNLDQLYRQVIMDHYKNPRNRGELDGALTFNLNNPTCGDRIKVSMEIEDGKIKEAKFEGEGCSISLASASMMTETIKGLPVEDALKLSNIFSEMMLGKEYDEGDLDLGDLEALQGVSKFPARIKCATLAWKALEKGVNQKEEE
ncbi:Fe-S cluster assembly sulfur transfer protein SufU [Pseudalkalibacillus salsuginis]|uniref:Fe-S cluster assembly sulfur transfer protein SufU n=1 Tax=Pseudalkalibacillus salsuginis TaxID=2910972 RepID=UPI001CD658C3|nr:SUF system NifU family Fe-S cluster assembly protein [Pseudalkalibacillus salsuginis]MCF6410406.1 SUF system NifU family Fe-S cluster assembly protein [Pseudalkalibacillus salsuginis]